MGGCSGGEEGARLEATRGNGSYWSPNLHTPTPAAHLCAQGG